MCEGRQLFVESAARSKDEVGKLLMCLRELDLSRDVRPVEPEPEPEPDPDPDADAEPVTAVAVVAATDAASSVVPRRDLPDPAERDDDELED